MKRLQVVLDKDGKSAIGTNRSTYVDARVLAANVAEVHTVPAGARYVLFSATNDFYANFNAAAAVPAADIENGTASILNPGLRSIEGAVTIGLISGGTCVLTMEFYA